MRSGPNPLPYLWPMKHMLLFLGLSGATLSGLAQNAPGAAGSASASETPAKPADTAKVQELVLREVYVIPAHIGHAQQQIVLTPKMPAQHLPEVLEANAASLDVRSRGLNDVQSDFSLRGSTFDQVHVVIDGVPYTDPQTGHHSGTLPVPMEAIQSVNVLPSGGSYRHGPFALAGVVEVTTVDVRSARGYASASAGAFGYTRAAGGVPLRRTEKFASRLDLSYTAADGALSNTDFATWQAYLKAVRELGPNERLSATLGYSVKMFGAQSFYSATYPTQFEHLRGLTGSLRYQRNHLTVQVYARQLQDQFELFRQHPNYYVPYVQGRWIHVTDSTVTPSWYTGANLHRTRSLGGDVVATRVLGHQVITGGLDARQDQIWSNALGVALPDTLFTNWGGFTKFDARRNAGVFGSYRYVGGTRTWIQGDLRLNLNDRFGFDWLPNLGVQRRLTSGVWTSHALASMNRSFRLPTFTDLFYQLGGAQGSADLRPEYAWNSELGVQGARKLAPGRHGLTQLVATAYERRGVNLIDWIYRSLGGTQVLQADNVTSVRIRGLELAAAGQFYGAWSIRAQFAGHRASTLDGVSTYALDYLAQRVQLRWDSKLALRGGSPAPLQLGVSVVGQNRAGSFLNAAGELVAYAPFATLDLRASYRLGELLLFADGMNLLDATVIDRGSVPLPGRWVKLGLRLEWGE